MAGVATEESGATRPSGEALAEWRSLDQVENGTPLTSPPYWDIEDGEDGGPKPSELYGKYTWKIDKFSQINKRELRSNAFEVGGYKWHILIYPQGCDVCNYLSLFLCVANHDKLLPGWGHFAQFTIAVVNKDPKKSKYSDTLHRFCKKEHDWGWKKFMELPKVMDGFIDADTLTIKAQVQVIRERAERPFRCLDRQYRRELVRVYLTNVEQICLRFVEEQRTKLEKLMEDKVRWSSFCVFWLEMDQSSRRRISRERTESILKVIVKQFFVDKEVTSTLVMDSLYSGLKALQGQNKGDKSRGNYMDAEESPIPVILIEEDMFVLVDDVLLLLERAAMEPLPPKEEKGPQNRTKDGSGGEEFSKDSIELDEKRLSELGRRTIEIFVLSHIFSKIEVAYKEAVSLMMQEELIREEEAAWRGAAEKKFKKKQGKHKKHNHKGKDKIRDKQLSNIAQDKMEPNVPSVEIKDFADESEMFVENPEAMEDISDASDSVDFVAELLPLDSEDRDAICPANWDTDTSEVHPPTEASSSGISVLSGLQIETEGRSSSLVDDSSSTCSNDSILSVATNVPHTGNYRHYKNQKYPTRGMKHQSKVNYDNWVHEEPIQPSEAVSGAGLSINASQSSDTVETMCQADVGSLKDKVNGTYRSGKEEEGCSTHANFAAKDVDMDASRERTPSATSPSWNPSKSTPCKNPVKLESKANTTASDPVILKKSLPDSPKQVETTLNFSIPKPTENTIPVRCEKTSMPPTMPTMPRPLSAPLFSAAPATRPSVSMVTPAVSRSVSASGQLGPTETSKPTTMPSSQSYFPQSHRNAIIGNNAASNYYSLVNNNASTSYTHNRQLYPRNNSDSMFSLGMVNHDALQGGPLWMNASQSDHALLLNDMQSLNSNNRSALADEFPHLDIINDLLDDNYVYGNTATPHSGYHNISNGLNRQFSFPGDPVMASGLGPSCRFERSRSYRDDGFQHGYGGYDMIPQTNPRPYLNGQIDSLMPNQWQIPGSSDMPFPGNASDVYPYLHIPPDYPNISVGVNGFSVFRPSNGQ